MVRVITKEIVGKRTTMVSTKGFEVVLTASRAVMSDYRGNQGMGLSSAFPSHPLFAPFIKPTVIKVAAGLRKHLTKIKEPNTYSFVEQAIQCFEAEFHRAAVVLSWVGAISVLYEHVRKNKLADFNEEAIRRFPKWKPAKTKDDLARMKEKHFLEVLEGISVIGKSVKDELETCLKLRNGCGHPNSLKLAEHRVSSHLETLILNVFSQFKA